MLTSLHLLDALQVPETFDATSYQQALSAIHEEFQNEPLSAEKLELVLQLAQELAGLVKEFWTLSTTMSLASSCSCTQAGVS